MSMSMSMSDERPIMLDASTYMLVEATGDSESEYYDTAAELGGAAVEDDAESCSSAPHQIDGAGGGWVDTGFDDYVKEDGSGGCTAEVEDGVVDQSRGGGATVEMMNKSKSKGCDDSDMIKKLIMSEKEMDRLFWEACLAS